MDGASHPLHRIFFYAKNLKFSEMTLKSEPTGPLITLMFRKEAEEPTNPTNKTLECVAEIKLRSSISFMTY